jgi:hypothetical protein
MNVRTMNLVVTETLFLLLLKSCPKRHCDEDNARICQ